MAIFDLPLAKLKTYKSPEPEPRDFGAFWKATLKETAGRGIATLPFVLVFTVSWLLTGVGQAAADDVGPPATFAGVLCDDTGRPVVGATVVARNVGPLYCGMTEVQNREATTDERGRFSLATGFYPVYISVRSEAGVLAYGNTPYNFGQEVPRPQLRVPDHRLVLMRWASVRGRVVDDVTGAPVREFRVHFASFSSHAPRSYESKDGRFAEARVTPGTQTISVMAKGYAPTVLHAVPVSPGSTVEVGVVRMAPGPTLRGRILAAEDGRPAAGAVIRFRDARTHAIVNYPPDELTATADEDGRFAVQNMPLLALEAYASVEDPTYRSATIGNVDMSLARDGVIEATFFFEDEDPPLPHGD